MEQQSTSIDNKTQDKGHPLIHLIYKDNEHVPQPSLPINLPPNPDPVSDFLSRERAAMEAIEGEEKDLQSQEQENYSSGGIPSLPFPPSPTRSGESSISDRPASCHGCSPAAGSGRMEGGI